MWRATERATGKRVAVKVVDKRLLLEPFLNMEVASLVRCHGHPHIMQLLAVYDVPANDVGPDGEWHLVMELAEGGELFERLLNHGAAASAEERASRRHGLAEASLSSVGAYSERVASQLLGQASGCREG